MKNKHFRDQFYFDVESKTIKAVKKICDEANFDDIWFCIRGNSPVISTFNPETYFLEIIEK